METQTRTAGRPQEYDREAALGAVAELFRELGYEGTSVRSLFATSGLSTHGIYRIFGGKEGLFLAALDDYHARILQDVPVPKPGEQSRGLDALHKYFEDLIAAVAQADPHFGCLMANTVAELASAPQGSAERTATFYQEVTERFVANAAAAARHGHLPAGMTPAVAGQFLTTLFMGLGQRAQAGASLDQLASALSVAWSALDVKVSNTK